jgi:8-oxo-dGTP pyrophosphatase MutT (NUDIX family)
MAAPVHVSAGIILVNPRGEILLQLRDDNPHVMFPGFWGITGGGGEDGEAPETTARREVLEETGLALGDITPFRVYHLGGALAEAPREVHIYHAPIEAGADELSPGEEGRDLRFFSPAELDGLPLAYNHREVLAEFVASPAYRRYVTESDDD